MATQEELETAIEDLLQHPLGVGNFELLGSGVEKAYEAYLFGLCLRAARELGGNPQLRAISAPPSPFLFRGAPGRIYSNRHNYGYAEFSVGPQDFEIHTGVEFEGSSGVLHELDVAIMQASKALKCRQQRIEPRASTLIVGLECKFYTANLPKSIGREFVGLIKDMSSNMWVRGLCSNSTSAQLKIYLSKQDRPTAHFSLEPSEPANERVIVNDIISALRKKTAT